MERTLDYFEKLDKNNNRTWFQENKSLYEQSHTEMIGFAESVLHEMAAHDYIETISGKKSLFRIYRDVRFGKDKNRH